MKVRKKSGGTHRVSSDHSFRAISASPAVLKAWAQPRDPPPKEREREEEEEERRRKKKKKEKRRKTEEEIIKKK